MVVLDESQEKLSNRKIKSVHCTEAKPALPLLSIPPTAPPRVKALSLFQTSLGWDHPNPLDWPQKGAGLRTPPPSQAPEPCRVH